MKRLLGTALQLSILTGSFGADFLMAQPTKEFIRVNGRVVAIESSAPPSICASAQTDLPFRGTGHSGSALFADGTVDPNWRLVSNPSAFLSTNAIVFTQSYGGGSAISKAINATGNTANVAPGAYIYRQSLDLSCHDPATTSISGNVNADDNVQIFVNGKAVGGVIGNWYSQVPFTIAGSSGTFIRGWNQIDFVVINTGSNANPSQVRVEVTNATATVVPSSNGTKFTVTATPAGGNKDGGSSVALSSGTETVTWSIDGTYTGSLTPGGLSNATFAGPGSYSALTVVPVKATSTLDATRVSYQPLWFNPGGGSVTITGATTNLAPYASRAFSATVSGAPGGSQLTVKWSVVSVPGSGFGLGLIDSGTNCVNSMNYRAPSTIPVSGNIVLKAESCHNPSWSSTISIPVAAGTSVSVAMSPKPATVNVSQTFSATVANADTPGVSWTLSPAAAGAISTGGVYTVAAGYTGNATVTARSIENTNVTDVHTFAASSTGPSYQSSLVSFAMPTSVVQGGSFSATVTMQNPAGGTPWDTSAGAGTNQVVMASQTPANNLNWRTNLGSTTTTSVAPNASAAFTITGRAPVGVTGVQTFDWQMRQGASNWFGPVVRPSTSVSVGVGTKNSQNIQISAPTTVNAGDTFNATVTMQNTGSATWWSPGVSGTNPFRLKYTGANPNLWITNLVQLPTEYIDNGQNAVFTIPVTAPNDPGAQPFNWQMEQAGLGTFGAIASRTIEVKTQNPGVRNVNPTSGTALEPKFGS